MIRIPQYSPDGKYIAWQSMERDGYEADLNRLFIMNLETGEKRFVSKAFESNVDAFVVEQRCQEHLLHRCMAWRDTDLSTSTLPETTSLRQLTSTECTIMLRVALCGDKTDRQTPFHEHGRRNLCRKQCTQRRRFCRSSATDHREQADLRPAGDG